MSFLKKIPLLIILPFFLSGCLQATITAKEYRVRQVIDGDTIELDNGQTVRYIGIDTPEIRRRHGDSWVYEPQPYAEKAKELNRQLVEKKVVRLEFDVQKKDKCDRLLAYCFVDDLFVNAKILEEGLAFLYTFSPNVKYVDLLVEKQKSARQNNRGIWAELVIIAPKDAKGYLNQIVTVEGKVSSLRQSPKVSILSFGRSKFKAVIFKEESSFFLASGISIPKAYKGKTVRVTGKIQEYKDTFEIIVRHPSAIEVIDWITYNKVCNE
jgi:endonuclease YncB( thermonuclease family)